MPRVVNEEELSKLLNYAASDRGCLQAKRGDFVHRVEQIPNRAPTDHGHWKPINTESKGSIV